MRQSSGLDGASVSDIPAADLARELNLPVAEVLARADKMIGKVVMEDGIDAARGLTTRVRQHGQVAEMYVSGPLADMLRKGSK